MNYLITGGTGSLGTALAHRLYLEPTINRIVLFSRDEYKQSQMAVNLAQLKVTPRVSPFRFFLGDVRDRDRLSHAMHSIDVVIHAAALKRVDSISYNPAEVIKTNVLGTMNVVEAAWANGVRKVVVVSSDKAVEPMNIYGFSKGLAEAYAIAANAYTAPSGTIIAVVRYGNVLGSRGSVLEVWRGKTEVRAAKCTRFWLTLDQACSFILKVVEKMFAGGIYIPKLKAASVSRLAEAAGLRVTGIEPLRVGGEKTAEKLLSTDELGRTYDAGFAFVVMPAIQSWDLTTKFLPGDILREQTEYSSDTVEQFAVEELRGLIHAAGTNLHS